jgi:signal transduction histidine kinase
VTAAAPRGRRPPRALTSSIPWLDVPSARDEGLARRLSAVTGARLLLTTALLGGAAILYLRGGLGLGSPSSRVVLITIALAYALSAVEAMLLRSKRERRWLAYAHVVVDQLLWTAIVYVTGGAASGATSFYGLSVLIGAIVIGLRGAATAALVGYAAYALLCAAFATKLVLPPTDQPAATYATHVSDMGYPLLVNGLGITVVAVLAGYLAERLRAAGGALAVATQRYTEAERLAELGRIAAWLAHEVRNPLGSISGSIELLGDSPALSPEDRALCDIVSREVHRLNDLVGDMLDLSKARPVEVEKVDVASMAREVVALAARAPAPASGVTYEGPDVAYAIGDAAQLRQVLWNLVRNAKQASADGTPVFVRASEKGDVVELAVDDAGPGIDAAAREKIWGGFYTTRSHGTGIGLAVVKRIMDDHAKHGGAIEVSSSPEKGGRFLVTLRRAR